MKRSQVSGANHRVSVSFQQNGPSDSVSYNHRPNQNERFIFADITSCTIIEIQHDLYDPNAI